MEVLMPDKGRADQESELLAKLEDILNSQVALIEKLANVQMDALNAGLQELMDSLDEPFSNASRNRDLLKKIREGLEMERNRHQLDAG
jgi:hypothetical protein